MIGTAVALAVMVNAILYVTAYALEVLLCTALCAVAAHAVFFAVVIVHFIFSFLLAASLVCPFDTFIVIGCERFKINKISKN